MNEIDLRPMAEIALILIGLYFFLCIIGVIV